MKKSLQKIISLSILATFLTTPLLAKAEINKEQINNEAILQKKGKENKQQESNE